jgi:hypothetical protein
MGPLVDVCVTMLQSTVAKPDVLQKVLEEALGKDAFRLDVSYFFSFYQLLSRVQRKSWCRMPENAKRSEVLESDGNNVV